VTRSPEDSVTVAVFGFVVRGIMNRAWRSTGLYFPAMPARSPVTEWQVEHVPAPLNQALPACASPVNRSVAG
jgi:hypothetical protein